MQTRNKGVRTFVFGFALAVTCDAAAADSREVPELVVIEGFKSSDAVLAQDYDKAMEIASASNDRVNPLVRFANDA